MLPEQPEPDPGGQKKVQDGVDGDGGKKGRHGLEADSGSKGKDGLEDSGRRDSPEKMDARPAAHR